MPSVCPTSRPREPCPIRTQPAPPESSMHQSTGISSSSSPAESAPSSPPLRYRLLHQTTQPAIPPAIDVRPMAQQSIEAHRPGAEIYTGDDLCRQKAIDLLQELNLPRGLLPIENVEEIGINRRTGFVWLRQKKALNYTFRKAGRLVSYGAEVTGFVEDRRMRRVTGVKSREMLIWIPLGEFFVDPKDPTKITFRTPAGLSKTYPASAFELEEQGNQRLIA